MILRQRVNDATRATMLAYASGTDLDNRAADYDVQRLLITPADPDAIPPVEAVWESDERLRYRCQMALEGLSVAGSRGAYVFHALSASPLVGDVAVDSPQPGTRHDFANQSSGSTNSIAGYSQCVPVRRRAPTADRQRPGTKCKPRRFHRHCHPTGLPRPGASASIDRRPRRA